MPATPRLPAQQEPHGSAASKGKGDVAAVSEPRLASSTRTLWAVLKGKREMASDARLCDRLLKSWQFFVERDLRHVCSWSPVPIATDQLRLDEILTRGSAEANLRSSPHAGNNLLSQRTQICRGLQQASPLQRRHSPFVAETE
mmetsp:Transcript_24294/g.63744  ORF Transcript_24294/g.63744 Transcript_24294/m.63744 type:complete len:143 (-) Transcript_24294:671-1099(-)